MPEFYDLMNFLVYLPENPHSNKSEMLKNIVATLNNRYSYTLNPQAQYSASSYPRTIQPTDAQQTLINLAKSDSPPSFDIAKKLHTLRIIVEQMHILTNLSDEELKLLQIGAKNRQYELFSLSGPILIVSISEFRERIDRILKLIERISPQEGS